MGTKSGPAFWECLPPVGFLPIINHNMKVMHMNLNIYVDHEVRRGEFLHIFLDPYKIQPIIV
jgi:hypothetical protein